MTPEHAMLLTNARHLLERPDPATAGLWPRATALVTRQVLEGTLDDFWSVRASGLEQCSARAQLLCLPLYLHGAEALAVDVSYAWSGLTQASHQHAYELPPTSAELIGWIEVVERLVAHVAAIVAAAGQAPSTPRPSKRSTSR